MSFERLRAMNPRGRRIPVVLGVALAAGLLAIAALASTAGRLGAAGWGTVTGSLLVAAAGVIDDLTPDGPRGLRNHLRALAGGHVTTGILKLVVTVAAAIVVLTLLPLRPGWARIAGVVLVAGCTNLWNALDVAPGRSLKVFLAVDAILLFAVDWAVVPGVPILFALGVPALIVDVRERAMLGDAGSNLLGFTAGLGLFVALPDWGVAVVALVVLGLNVAADVVSLSRVIDGSPPLRWVDRLGRLPADASGD